MRTALDQEDIELIAQRVLEVIKPFLTIKEDDKGIIFSVNELAEYLRVSTKWVYDHAYELPHFKLGGFLRFKKKEIDSAVDRLSLKSANDNIVRSYLDKHN
jgi:excisionase family DNA binding protein